MAWREYPEWLAVISYVTLLVGAICFLLVSVDIALKRRKSMMAIMTVVYPINMLYWGPLGVWAYWHIVVRPTSKQGALSKDHHHTHNHAANAEDGYCNTHSQDKQTKEDEHSGQGGHCAHHGPKRPMWQSVAVSVSHCGAGCVLGDIVGEWIVWGAGWTINGRALWPQFLMDFGLALLFGIVFQYLNIAPMTGNWGWKGVWMSVKADILSLTAFEIGLFGWMAIFSLAIFQDTLHADSSIYWFMMQIGMLAGKATSSPMNWWLIKAGIKQPCA